MPGKITKKLQIAISFWAVSTLLIAAPHRKLPPRLYDITPLRPKAGLAIPLMGSESVRPKGAMAPGAKIFFEDKEPSANWGHAGAFKIFDPLGNLVEEIPTQLPPKNLNSGIGGLFGNFGQPATFAVSDLDGKFRVAHPQNFYALLINGNADQRHWNDFSFLYRVLTQVYGYHKTNIFVADSVHIDKDSDLDGDKAPDIQYRSGVADVTALLAKLKEQLGKDDHLLVAVNDHGVLVDGKPVLVLFDGQVKAADFGKQVSDIPAGKILSIYEQCYSGGFVRPTTGSSRVAMAAATDQEISWANEDLTFDEFLYHTISAFAGQTHDGKPISADNDKDGKITAQEAFAYATAKDTTPETPLMESEPNAGTASQIGFGF